VASARAYLHALNRSIAAAQRQREAVTA